jgi:hypothetical protein
MSDITGPNEVPQPAIQLDEPRMPPPALPPILEAPPVFAPGPRPIPFEDVEGIPSFWHRVGAMFRMVFHNPMELFDRVPATDSIGAPWRFLMLLSIPVFLIAGLVFFLLGMGVMMAALEQSGKGDGRAIAAVMPIIYGVILVFMPLFTFLGMLIGGTFSHFFLWMWGGLRPGVGLNQTIRAYGYTSAFLQIGSVIPYLNVLIQLAGMVVMGMGLARMHKTDTWRGVCAVLTPLVLVCCCCLPLIVMAIPALAALGHR